ncbi:hypothetical protein PR048_005913 [Dryococelus australis]|uniref:Uncharacterized protein n=1 Tax=Dryococelus australis TaxID=614101 RepID=A0ABQ9I9J2_9NEOP|nr:hypothetical protein PR048_005913 [Dryococelus australis]
MERGWLWSTARAQIRPAHATLVLNYCGHVPSILHDDTPHISSQVTLSCFAIEKTDAAFPQEHRCSKHDWNAPMKTCFRITQSSMKGERQERFRRRRKGFSYAWRWYIPLLQEVEWELRSGVLHRLINANTNKTVVFAHAKTLLPLKHLRFSASNVKKISKQAGPLNIEVLRADEGEIAEKTRRTESRSDPAGNRTWFAFVGGEMDYTSPQSCVATLTLLSTHTHCYSFEGDTSLLQTVLADCKDAVCGHAAASRCSCLLAGRKLCRNRYCVRGSRLNPSTTQPIATARVSCRDQGASGGRCQICGVTPLMSAQSISSLEGAVVFSRYCAQPSDATIGADCGFVCGLLIVVLIAEQIVDKIAKRMAWWIAGLIAVRAMLVVVLIAGKVTWIQYGGWISWQHGGRSTSALDLRPGTGINGRGKREIPEKTRRLTTSSGTIPTCESPVTRSGIEPGSPWWRASVLITQPPWPLWNKSCVTCYQYLTQQTIADMQVVPVVAQWSDCSPPTTISSGAWLWVPEGWDIQFQKLWTLSIFLDPECPVCTGSVKVKALRSTVDNAVAVQSYLMIVTGRCWVSDVNLTDLCNKHYFHGIWKQKTHQSAPVNSMTPSITLIGLVRLLIGHWRTGNMWPGLMNHDTGFFSLMAVFGYGANPMRPWIPVVNKAPSRLVAVP